AGLQRAQHMMIVRRRNNVPEEPDISLSLVDDTTFRDALSGMGIPEGEHDRCGRETGHSATILRRRLSRVPAIREPAWAADVQVAYKLIPLNLAGVWNAETEADREIVGLLTKTDYPDVET